MKDEQLEALKRKRDQLNARIAKHNAQAQAQRRRDDTRRKIIAGAVLLEAVAADRTAEKPLGIAKWWDSKRRDLRPQDQLLFDPSVESSDLKKQ